MPSPLGRAVRRLRESAGLTQGQVEQYARGKIKRSWLSYLEAGKIATPPPEKLEVLARIIGTTVTDIYRLAGIVEFPGAAPVNPEEQNLLEAFRNLPDELKPAALKLIRDLNSAISVTVTRGGIRTETEEIEITPRRKIGT